MKLLDGNTENPRRVVMQTDYIEDGICSFYLERSYPADRGEALEGKMAFSESFFTLSRERRFEGGPLEKPFCWSFGTFGEGSLISGPAFAISCGAIFGEERRKYGMGLAMGRKNRGE